VGDNDWYWFSVSDDAFCDVQPRVTLTVPAGLNLDLCAYFECANGEDVDLDCIDGVKVAGPKAGVSGCCSSQGGSSPEAVRLEPTCSFLSSGDEGGFVDVHVIPVSGNVCTPYTLGFTDS
jgi:hypothetical protein